MRNKRDRGGNLEKKNNPEKYREIEGRQEEVREKLSARRSSILFNLQILDSGSRETGNMTKGFKCDTTLQLDVALSLKGKEKLHLFLASRCTLILSVN